MYEWALDAAERALAWLGDLIKDIAHAIAMLGACLAGIIVHNLAEADNILMNFWKTPRRMSSSFQDEVKDLSRTSRSTTSGTWRTPRCPRITSASKRTR
jgi:hypothetical protein